MNWNQAVRAMRIGYKVRGTEWGPHSWMSSTVTYAEDYELKDLWSLTYELLIEEPEKGASKCPPTQRNVTV